MLTVGCLRSLAESKSIFAVRVKNSRELVKISNPRRAIKDQQPCPLSKVVKLHFIFIEQNAITLILFNVPIKKYICRVRVRIRVVNSTISLS